MPMMNELIEKLNENPPQNERDLMDLLSDTGYSLEVDREGGSSDMDEEYSSDDDGMEMSGKGMDEDMEEGEEEEDMGPKDASVEIGIMKEMMPMASAMPGMPPGASPQMLMQIKRRGAAKKALKGGK